MLGDGGVAPEDRSWSDVYREWFDMTHNAINASGRFSSGPRDVRDERF